MEFDWDACEFTGEVCVKEGEEEEQEKMGGMKQSTCPPSINHMPLDSTGAWPILASAMTGRIHLDLKIIHVAL